jgi:hypothetical protein
LKKPKRWDAPLAAGVINKNYYIFGYEKDIHSNKFIDVFLLLQCGGEDAHRAKRV